MKDISRLQDSKVNITAMALEYLIKTFLKEKDWDTEIINLIIKTERGKDSPSVVCRLVLHVKC